MGALELAEVKFGRYNDAGRLVEEVVSRIDIETGSLFPDPVELAPGTWLVLWPGNILGKTPLIVRRTTRFDKLVPS